MLSYYPPIHPYATHKLSVSDIHTLYVEESGNPHGVPVLFVHGGPGGGTHDDNRRYFDPNDYRIILFDQRGSGRSTPHAELQQNTTHDLVADMEKIREALEVDKWVLFGGSWGSTLSLVYAIHHPDRVKAMILRGIFLNRKQDVDWFINGTGANYIFPDFWEEFVNHIPADRRSDLIAAYHELLTGEDEIARMSAAKAWSMWEARCSTLEPSLEVLTAMQTPHLALSLARIECHYFLNNCFLEPNFILDNANRLKDIPGVIIHGRYDMVCSLENAWTLQKAWKKSELHIIRDAGHSGNEAGIVDGLIHAARTMAL